MPLSRPGPWLSPYCGRPIENPFGLARDKRLTLRRFPLCYLCKSFCTFLGFLHGRLNLSKLGLDRAFKLTVDYLIVYRTRLIEAFPPSFAACKPRHSISIFEHFVYFCSIAPCFEE